MTKGQPAPNELRLVNGVRLISFQGKQVQVPDSKGLGDLAVLIGAHGADVHVLTLIGFMVAAAVAAGLAIVAAVAVPAVRPAAGARVAVH